MTPSAVAGRGRGVEDPVRHGWRALRRHVAAARRQVVTARATNPDAAAPLGTPDASGARVDRAVHEARKALKRARAFARLLAPALGAAVADELDRRARDAGRALAPLRDAAAARAALDAVRAHVGTDADLDADAWAAVARACGAEAGGPERPAASAALDAATADLEVLRALLRTTERPAPSAAAWARGLRRLHRSARRTARAALASPDDDERVHAARAAWKRLGLAVRAYRAVAPALVGPWVTEVEAVCALLGDDHDQVVLRERLAAGVEGVPEAVLERLRAASWAVGSALRAEALPRLAWLAAEPSKGFAARHRAYVAPT
ncbi:MAG: CHAD domain-containing protein [Trueperaceae bacterium]|nr:CHAD domain-containing protein [Trueperaceae bacterium]